MWLLHILNLHYCVHSQARCSTDKWTHASLKSESRSVILHQLELSYAPETKDVKSELKSSLTVSDLLMRFCACVSSVEMHLWTPDRPVSVSHTCHRNRVSTTSCLHLDTTQSQAQKSAFTVRCNICPQCRGTLLSYFLWKVVRYNIALLSKKGTNYVT